MNSILIPLPEDFGQEIRDMIKRELREGIRELADELQLKPFLTPKEVQELLGISWATLQKLHDKGLEPFRIDRKILYSRAEIEKLLTGERG